MSREQADFAAAFFAGAPSSLLFGLSLKTYPKNHVLISTDDGCAHVYLLLSGRLQAIEEYVPGEPYRFTELLPLEIVGDFELFTRCAGRMITLTTLERSEFLVIPAADYLAWIQNDANALFIRMQMLIRQMVSQTKFERQNLFLDNRSRLTHLLCTEYGHRKSGSEICLIEYTRQELSTRIGCSVRTVNRLIKALSDEGYIRLRRGKIRFGQEQYLRMKAALERSKSRM